jgi:hypothetical protein
MNNRDIFIQEYPAHSSRTITLPDGGAAYPYSALAVGRIEGLHRSITALVSDDATDKDNWYVCNIEDASTSAYLQTVAVLGSVSEAQAKSWAVKNIGIYLNGEPCCNWPAITSAKALKVFLDRSAASGQFAITQTMLDNIAKQITDVPIKWLNDTSCELVSHNRNTSELLHEMVKNDDEGQLVDSMNSTTDLADLLAELGANEVDDYNALIVQYDKFDQFMSRMNQAMAKAAVNKLSITDMQKTKPFKRNNVVNIALLWMLSDGQNLTLVFHNPDSTPSKLQPTDTLTSWKAMLNKRDISAAVLPENGKNAQPTIISQRMMLLAEKNSARFVRNNAKKDEKLQQLVDLDTANQAEQEAIAGILAENETLQKQIDEVVAQNAKPQIEPKTKPKKATVAEAKDAYDTLDYSVTDLLGHRADEFKAADVVGRLQPKIEVAQALIDRGVRSDWADRLIALVKKAQGLILSWQTPNPPQPTHHAELDVDELPALGIANITSIGNENIYLEKDGKSYFSKVGNTQDYSVGEWDFSKALATAEPPQNASEPTPHTNSDHDTPLITEYDKNFMFLQLLISGKDTGLEPKAITAKIREIISSAKGESDGKTLALADKAAKAYAEQVKAKAVAKLSEVNQ